MRKLIILFIIPVLLISCTDLESIKNNDITITKTWHTESADKTEQIIDPAGGTIESRFHVPEGFERAEAEEGSFADFIRHYPLKKYGSPILLFDGKERVNQSNHEAVFDMKLGEKDLQQCADSIMRIYAEYLYKTDQKDKIAFHFVNGFLCDYRHWSEGYRVVFSDSGTAWQKRGEFLDNEETFENYLEMVFEYASTLSMVEESKKIDITDIQIGDIFIKGGAPGHVVMVADVCKDRNGDKAFLLAQGFMPAQEFHILKNPSSTNSCWYKVSEIGNELIAPECQFMISHLRRVDYCK